MPHSEICVVFTPFIEFLTLYKEAILDAPYDGHVDTIRIIFREFCAEVPAKEKTESRLLFLNFIADFNAISGHSLVFGAESDDKLVWVKVANVLLLKNRLKETEPEVTKSLNYIVTENFAISQLPYSTSGNKNIKKQLKEILDSDSQTVISCEAPLKMGFDCDISKLEKMLAKPSAMIVLGIRRAQLRTTQKPFYEVCEETNHSQTIANLCLNLKSIGSGFHELPTNAKIHKVISSCKSLLNTEVVACVQSKIHFLPLLTNNTDLYLGNCSYLDTCHKLKNCRYLHYYTLNPTEATAEPSQQRDILSLDYTIGECHDTISRKETPAQWINCDVRYLPFKVLGKFAAIISDPAWDIHMSLPYGTCKDSELLSLPMKELQDEGVLMLWVTGRSIEIGRKALDQWGYTVSDEMIWIKLNQLRKTIVTGRTGHWLNHSKEHLLVGVKGNPIWLNRKIDIDFIVSGTRETSRKPDELYGIVDRLVGKHARKLEIFGRDNNIRPGWITIGNQLTGTYIYEEEVKQKYIKYQASAKKSEARPLYS